MQQLRINFGMILPTKFGLEQFLEMTKALKHIEDKYMKPQQNQYNRHESSKQGNNSNKENQQPHGSPQLTSQTSQPSQITRNAQIGNISVEQMARSLGSDLDHPSGSTRGGVLCISTYQGAGHPGEGVSLTSTIIQA